MKVIIPVVISRRFSRECFLIVKLLQSFQCVKKRVDTLFYSYTILLYFTLFYTILLFFFSLSPEFKKVLLYDVKSSPFSTVCCDESLNTDLQMHQMDAAVRFWNDKTGLAEQDILTYNLSKGQLLRIYLPVCMNL